MKNTIISIALVSTLALGACAADGSQNTWGMGTKQTVGTGLGAIAGGLLGSKVGSGSGRDWAIGAGVLMGAFVGSEVGKSLDRADLAYHKQATEQAYVAPINETIAWENPESGHSGSVTPIEQGTDQVTGNYCRKYEQTIVIDGQAETAIGTACRQADGTWELVNG